MKKYFITPLILISAILTGRAQIPNAGFEQINSNNSLAYWQSPAIAITVGDSIVFNGPLTERFAESVAGKYCLSMRNAYDFTQNYGIAGGAYANNDSLANSSFQSHFALTDRPDSLIFYYKYKVNEGDTGSCTVEILNEQMYETGRGYIEVTGVANDFLRVSVPISYQSTDPAAFARIYFKNGLSEPKFSTHLLVDELAFIYNNPTIIPNKDNIAQQVMVYPNPTRGHINIKSTLPISRISLINTNGTVLRQYEKQEVPDLSAFPTGIYFLHIRSTAGTIVKTITRY